MNGEMVPAPDPYAVLGISGDADDEQIRAAYLAKLKQFPPDRCPAEFELVRDANNVLRDRRKRAENKLFSIDPAMPLRSLLKGIEDSRQFAGPQPWLAVLKGK